MVDFGLRCLLDVAREIVRALEDAMSPNQMFPQVLVSSSSIPSAEVCLGALVLSKVFQGNYWAEIVELQFQTTENLHRLI
jgi:hypothetical protein